MPGPDLSPSSSAQFGVPGADLSPSSSFGVPGPDLSPSSSAQLLQSQQTSFSS